MCLGLIGDIYKLEERGQATGMGICIHFSTSLSKVGFNAGFCRPSLLLMPVALHSTVPWAKVGFLPFFVIIFYLPETFHPKKRGTDNLASDCQSGDL